MNFPYLACLTRRAISTRRVFAALSLVTTPTSTRFGMCFLGLLFVGSRHFPFVLDGLDPGDQAAVLPQFAGGIEPFRLGLKSQAEEAITKLLERDKLVIRVNPADEDLMKEHKAALLRMFDGTEKIEVISDAGVERGGCIVETDLVKVDAQPCTQLQAARKALLAEEER